MEDFISVGVAGAHGKTSTTGILAHVMKNAVDTSYLIGDGTGRGNADSEYFVFESDEYERHFMPYHPEYTIITNVDFDHPDYFQNIDDVASAFQDYAQNIKKVFSFSEKILIYVKLQQKHRFTIMVLKMEMIIKQKISSAQHAAHLLMLISVVKKSDTLSCLLMGSTILQMP